MSHLCGVCDTLLDAITKTKLGDTLQNFRHHDLASTFRQSVAETCFICVKIARKMTGADPGDSEAAAGGDKVIHTFCQAAVFEDTKEVSVHFSIQEPSHLSATDLGWFTIYPPTGNYIISRTIVPTDETQKWSL